MKNRRNYYRILQVQPDAPIEVIRASYRTLMRELKYHPDLGGSSFDAAVLNEAYETLSDTARRAAYDKELFIKYSKKSQSSAKQPIVPVFCPVCKRPLSRKPAPGEICSVCQTPLKSESGRGTARFGRRSVARIKSSDRIYYYSAWPGKVRQGKMVDFSPKGMQFVCGEKLLPETVLKIRSSLFEASGTVTTIREQIIDGQKSYAVGVCFLAVTFANSKGTFFSTSA